MAKSRVLKTPRYDKTVKALQLAGMSERTQQCYARSVRQLIEYYNKDPREITEEELKEFFCTAAMRADGRRTP